MNIAIDGPSGSGKSTIAKIIAKKMHISYLDTGAMYRAIGYYVLQNGVDPSEEEKVVKLIEDITMDIGEDNGVQQVSVNGENVTPYIRENRISMAASTVSKIPAVRIKLVELQRKIAAKSDCVLDGRDIGSYVLPNAEYKFFMTADSFVRAQRRHDELKLKGEDIPVETLREEIEKRDAQDKNRSFAPLVCCEDAVVIDTSNLTIEEVTELVLSKICK
ncbi:MAG: (d)CMP kinase [Clostridia bacterium]|nr:(d)CMP kinase [Clostridia bacterium]